MSRNIINQHPIYTWYYSYPEKEKRMLAQGDWIWQNTFGVSLDDDVSHVRSSFLFDPDVTQMTPSS